MVSLALAKMQALLMKGPYSTPFCFFKQLLWIYLYEHRAFRSPTFHCLETPCIGRKAIINLILSYLILARRGEEAMSTVQNSTSITEGFQHHWNRVHKIGQSGVASSEREQMTTKQRKSAARPNASAKQGPVEHHQSHLKWESLKKRRKDNRLILLYKGQKGKASIPTAYSQNSAR